MKKESQPFWKRMFCVCSEEEAELSSKGSRSMYKANIVPYTPDRKKMRESQKVTESAISLQLQSINEANENEIQFITNRSETMCFLVKFTGRQFKYQERDFRADPRNIFEIYHNQHLHLDLMDKTIAPQSVCRYIALRCKSANTILEINSQYNQHSIQFSIEGKFVYAFSKDCNLIQKGAENKRAYKAENRIEQVLIDFSKLEQVKIIADLVFLNLTNYKKSDKQEMYQLLVNALTVSSNLIILCKGKIKAPFIIHLLSKICETQPKLIPVVSLEEETISINGQDEYTIIYYGQPSKISISDEISAIQKSLLLKSSIFRGHDLTDCIYQILVHVNNKIGPLQLVKIFLDVLYTSENDFILNNFLSTLEEKEIFNHEQLQELILSQKSPSQRFQQSVQNHPSTSKKLTSYILQNMIDQSQKNQSISFNLNYTYDKTQHTDIKTDGFCNDFTDPLMQSFSYKN